MSKRTSQTQQVKCSKILLVDKHPVCCEGLESIIRRAGNLVVCGHANDAAAALSAVARHKPDLVITDIDLPGKSGIELLRDLKATLPGLPVLVVSDQDESVYAEWVLRAGGRGYVTKQATPEQILMAISTVLAGGVYVSAQISAALMNAVSSPQPVKSTSPMPQLTQREFEIFRLIGKGKDGHEIANTLHTSLKTVDTHRGRIKEKLHFTTATALTHYATLWMAGIRSEG